MTIKSNNFESDDQLRAYLDDHRRRWLEPSDYSTWDSFSIDLQIQAYFYHKGMLTAARKLAHRQAKK